MTHLRTSDGIFLSYPRDLQAQAEALGAQLVARGLSVLESNSLVRPSGGALRAEIDELIHQASTFVVLVPIHGASSHWQQFEISQILEVAWAKAETVVAVVAPAIGAIPSALRHQQFVRYFPHDVVGFDAWSHDSAGIDRFIDELDGPLAAKADSPPDIDALSLRLWRDRIVHLGRTESADDHSAHVRAVLYNVADAKDADMQGVSPEIKTMLEAANYATGLEAKDLFTEIYNLTRTIDIDSKLVDATNFELLYSRAKAALEVGRPSDALSDFLAAAEVNNKLRGTEDDPRTVAAVFNAAAAASSLGDNATAENLDRHALSIARRTLGPMHPQTGGIALHLARLVANDGRAAEAIELLREAEAAYAHATPIGSREQAEVAAELRKLEA